MAELVALHASQVEPGNLPGAGFEENDLACRQEDGPIWKPAAFDSAYHQLLKRRKWQGPTFHGLRNSHATHLMSAGVDPKAIAERPGHSRVASTLDTYIHALPGMREEASQRIESAMAVARKKPRPTVRVS